MLKKERKEEGKKLRFERWNYALCGAGDTPPRLENSQCAMQNKNWIESVGNGVKVVQKMLKEIDRHTNALSKLVEGLGFPKEQAEKALRECNDDVALASERLLRKQSEAGASRDPPYFSEAPPPYSEVELNPSSLKPPPYMKHDTAALLGEMKAQLNSDPEERCSSCFDPIRPDPSEGFSGNIVWKGLKVCINAFK